jgi:asparagine synthase (glutamine-hydrolysing)
LGIIPFFYTVTEEGLFLFASEIKALLAHPQVKKQVDLVGLDQVFTFPGLISPRTLFENIKSLPNGNFLKIRQGDSEITPVEYWDVIYPKQHEIREMKPESYYIDNIAQLFEKSVSYRLRADVPIGFYVSGGLDSAMITAKSVSLQSNYKKTFSINVSNEELSEAKYQRLLATHLDTSHEEIFFQPPEMLKRLKQVIYHTECPLRETYNTASLALSERVKAAGIKVVLSGEGADEFFAGYIGYRFDKMNFKRISGTEIEKELRVKLWGDSQFTYETDYSKHKETKRQLYSSHLRSQFDEFESTNHFVINKSKIENIHITHLRSYIDYKLRLCDHLVGDHGDRMALANGIECRYPFLDKDLIEFMATVPPELLLKDFQEKYILKTIARDFVPAPIIDRDKFAFSTPSSIEILLQNDEYINDLLSYERIKHEGYFDPDYVEFLKEKYSQPGFKIHAPYEHDLLISVITFGIFREVFDLPCM